MAYCCVPAVRRIKDENVIKACLSINFRVTWTPVASGLPR
uniref:Uncharacterized protein n=1 Tax=Anguilla anguilla TaxID=7936 RepID=A0A0E9U831_ANGAN